MVLSTTSPTDLQSLLAVMPELSIGDRALIEKAYAKAEKSHGGQKRRSGEPFFTHCVAVAGILAEMKLDAETVAAALMHDIIEDTPVTYEELRDEFGTTVADLVNGVTKLMKLPIRPIENEANGHKRSSAVYREMEYIRKMLLGMGNDVRVVLIKLADRLHNMRTLGYLSPERQQQIARETLDIFAPLANRLGIWQIKWELEDLSFRYLDKEAYQAIAKNLDERRTDREAYVAEIRCILQQELAKNGIEATITGRPKHIYSIHRKMQKKNVPLDKIYDIRAVRVIVNEIAHCYLVLGIVHSLWRPIPGEFDDYIAGPKDNFYRSLHTAVVDNQGRTLEVQIRTREMHEDAEYGIAAHWRYKEGIKRKNDKAFEERMNYLRRLMAGSEAGEDAEEFINAMKSDVFQDRVYAFTPNGDVVDLPAGATPIDFAYHIHTEIGHRCRGAKVRGRLVPLNYRLQSGDQVEIVTAKQGGPSMDWLNPDLGYVATARAREKIRHWYKKKNRDEHIKLGRDSLEQTLKRLGLADKTPFDAVAALFDYEKVDDFLAAIGAGDINSAQITHRVLEDERRKKRESEEELASLKARTRSSSLSVDASNGVNILGTDGLLVKMASCCNPMLGDEIIGYITRGRGVTVHRADCANVLSTKDRERLIEVSWGNVAQEQRYKVPLEIIAYDRNGLLSEISTVIANENVNITSVEVNTRHQIATLFITLEISNNQQLTRILSKVECIKNVVEARRRNMA